MEKFYTLERVAEILGIKVRTARQWVHDGKLKAIKYPGGRIWVVSESEINRLLDNSTTIDDEDKDVNDDNEE